MAHQFKVGDRVVVRPYDQIISSLDKDGCTQRLPFMPEMLQFYGRSFTVRTIVNYVCVETTDIRAMTKTVVLDNLFCTGTAHDMCQKACTLLWKSDWLQPDVEPVAVETGDPNANSNLQWKNHLKTWDEGKQAYFCQSTNMRGASFALSFWGKLQYVIKEFLSGNSSIFTTIKKFAAFIRFKFSTGSMNAECFTVKGNLQKTPLGKLGLQAGDMVEVKSIEEIAATLDEHGKNRGLLFTPEMHKFCGQKLKVLQRLENMISEADGTMVKLTDTVILENVLCHGTCKFGCSRQLPHYWREIWLWKL